MAKLRNTIEALERRVGRKRAAHQKLVARAERTQRRLGELATAVQQAETALADAVARAAARHQAKAARRRRPDAAAPVNGAAPAAGAAGAAALEVTTVAAAAEPEPEPAPVSAPMRTRATAIRRRTASPDTAAAPATTPRAPSQRRGSPG